LLFNYLLLHKHS